MEEQEKGVHGPRPDEKIMFCTRCGRKGFVKNGLCRRCRGVCEDCGREDVAEQELMEYGMGERLCRECYIERLY